MFERAGVPDVPKSTQCRVLRGIEKCDKPEIYPPLKNIHKKKRMDWPKNNTCKFPKFLFTDECRARGWNCKEGPRLERIRRQQVGSGVMFWAAIVGNELFGPFRVSDGVKMTAKVYMDFLKKPLVPWYRKKKLAFRKTWFSCMTIHLLVLQG